MASKGYPANAGVAGGGALALLLAGAACLLYARTRRKMLWSETAGKRPLDQHQSGAPMQLHLHLRLSSHSGSKPLWWHVYRSTMAPGCAGRWAMPVAVMNFLNACTVSDMRALRRFS